MNSFDKDKLVGPDKFEICPVSGVKMCLSTLSTNRATVLDLIPARFLKDGANVISNVTAQIVNLSINKFPDELKRAKLIPLFKKNSKSDVGNYRPVSI